MSNTFFRDTVLYLIKLPFFRQVLGRFARRRYGIDIDSSAVVSHSVTLNKHTIIEQQAVILPSATMSAHVTVKANAVLRGNAPLGSEVAGDPAQVVRFKQIGSRKTEHTPLAQEALFALVENFDFNTVLDIGCGEGWHATRLLERHKKVTCVDMGNSWYFRNNKGDDGLNTIIGDYLSIDFPSQFDCIWLSHVLEHQLNVQQFLEKIHRDLAEGGVLAITVPPLKNQIVGGHVNLFNMGLLLYRLILAGFDCRSAHCKRYGYNLSVILQKRSLVVPDIEYDNGDIEKLAEFFPFGAVEGFFGEIDQANWPWPPREFFDETLKR
ncbi:Malonyl-[acyl-carrier protein] O-methyltransferase [Halioglobus japonicus]|nr:Malonyl-[acyl-carrier protein] O-methyltransferase [Halioglobus japonicus]